ncbi:MAG: N-6 DNA methylase [Desulfomonile tiedjei]|nr:N-6 DNA methylase [Desulfomonile tiedjei]
MVPGNRVVQILCDSIGSQAAPARDPESFYRSAVAAVVGALLAPREATPVEPEFAGLVREAREIGPVSPEQVGELYEYLRGFRFVVKPGEAPRLAASQRGRRNQGLFYTPQPVVEHIVKTSLDALAIPDPAEYLDLRLLDPAVGTGTFLLEALDELSRRVLGHGAYSNGPIAQRIRQIHGETVAAARDLGACSEPDLETCVRLHIMSKCLYGVDLDPVAVRIAKAALKNRAYGGQACVPGIEPAIRVGNALVGHGGEAPIPASRLAADRHHATAYLGTKPVRAESIARWRAEQNILHWPLEYPEIFRERGGFDCIVGNPPYEILSVKESGIAGRRREQAYFRSIYRTCQGKINTYRLMTERALTLLRDGGVLGFIVPATLLADTTAEKLRRMILDESEIKGALVIPEKAQVFVGVTQALLILIARKGGPTRRVAPSLWQGTGPVTGTREVCISRRLIERAGGRIPILRSEEEKTLLERLMEHTPFRGDERDVPAGLVHQGEVNLTVDRAFITELRTDCPLVRGEHVMPLRVNHPSRREGRLDWVLPELVRLRCQQSRPPRRQGLLQGRPARSHGSFAPWEEPRIVLGRVVNMDTDRRLKAAAVPAGVFLGDMTNFICRLTVPENYLLGLLNSRLLNWRIKLTSTNNYLSAAEIEALPVPRISPTELPENLLADVKRQFQALVAGAAERYDCTIEQGVPAPSPRPSPMGRGNGASPKGRGKSPARCRRHWESPLPMGEGEGWSGSLSEQETVSIAEWISHLARLLEPVPGRQKQPLLAAFIELTVAAIRQVPAGEDSLAGSGNLWNALDAAVLMLFGCEAFANLPSQRR